jgi:hypothetical protein
MEVQYTSTQPAARKSESVSPKSVVVASVSQQLPEDVLVLINQLVATLKRRDIRTRLSLYADSAELFYTKHTLTHEESGTGLIQIYERYTDIRNVRLSKLVYFTTSARPVGD